MNNDTKEVGFTYEQRKILIESILISDRQYMNKLLTRKLALVRELEALDVMIMKKSAEIEAMQVQMYMANAMH